MSNMADVAAVKAVTLKPTTQELADRMKKEIKVEKNGQGKISENWYVDNLGAEAVPEAIKAKYPGIEADIVPIVKGVMDFNTRVAAAGGFAFGQHAEKVMHSHKDVTRCELEIPTIGKDGFEFTYDRERQVPSRNADGTTGTKTAYGMLRVGYRTYGAESVGELKKAKALLSQSATSVFGG
jgi:hypothetical protein